MMTGLSNLQVLCGWLVQVEHVLLHNAGGAEFPGPAPMEGVTRDGRGYPA